MPRKSESPSPQTEFIFSAPPPPERPRIRRREYYKNPLKEYHEPVERAAPGRPATIYDVREFLYQEYQMPQKERDAFNRVIAETSQYQPTLWMVEKLLGNKRDLAQTRPAESGMADRFRGLIRATSWRTYDRPSTYELNVLAHTLLNDILGRQQELRQKGLPDDAKNLDDARNMANAICQSLPRERQGRTIRPAVIGSDAHPALEAIESFYGREWDRFWDLVKQNSIAWDDLAESMLATPSRPQRLRAKGIPPAAVNALQKTAETIQRLRPLRDQIYFQYLYPGWFTEK